MYHLPEYCCSLRDSLHILMAAIFLDDRGPPPPAGRCAPPHLKTAQEREKDHEALTWPQTPQMPI